MPALTSTATVSRAAPLMSNLRPLASPFQPVRSTQNVASSSSWYQGPVQQTPSLSTIVYGQPQPPVSTVPLLGQVPYMNATSQSGVSSGDDILKQLRKVSIPVFDGNKRNFPSWRAAFMACIDKSSVAPEVKLLHLRQYLKGEALASIESLGFTASAYQAAIARLDRKFGGDRRQVAVYLDQIEAFPVLKQPKASELQRFADLLDVTVVNLKDSGRAYELQESTLYCKLQTKLSASMLTNYNRWCHVNSRPAHVESLLEWVNLEAEFTMNAVETIEGISGGTTKSAESNKQPHRDFTARTYFSSDQAVPASGRVAKSLSCQCCHGKHNIWKCPQFKESSVQERWQVAKTAGLCFRCLGSGHRSNACTWSRVSVD